MLSVLGRIVALLVGLLVVAFVYLYVIAPGQAYHLSMAAERALAGLEVKQTRAAGFEIRYLTGGTGEPLLLLHGFGADKSNWTRVAGELADDYRVIAPDLPGFGASDRPEDADYSVAAQAERVHAFVEALDLDAVHIGGNSMGGGIAGAYAAAHPDAIRSLWLLAPFGVAGAPPAALHRHIETGGDNLLLPRTHDQYYRLLDWVFENPPYIPAPVKYTLAQRAVQRRPLLSDIFEQLNNSDFDLAAALSDSEAPALIVWGRDDRLLSADGARLLAAAMPRAEVQMLEDTGHAPMLEKPGAVVRAFRAFQTDPPDAQPEPDTAAAVE